MKHPTRAVRHLPLLFVFACQSASPSSESVESAPTSTQLATIDFGNGAVEVPYRNVGGTAVLDGQIDLGPVRELQPGTVKHVVLDPIASPDPDDPQAMARFNRAPVITRITPRSPKAGDTITIDGFYFGRRRDANWVSVNAHPFRDLPTILSWSDRRIVAVLDADLIGRAEISVISERRHSHRRPLNLQLNCAAPAEFEKYVDLEDSSSSIAYDIVRTTNCRSIIVGTASVNGVDMGFFVETDEFGNNISKREYAPYVTQWSFIAQSGDSEFLLVGKDSGGKIVIARVDQSAEPLPGWPQTSGVPKASEVTGAAITNAQIAVVGINGEPGNETGFLYQYDLAGALFSKTVFDGDWPRRALGVGAVTGGFAVTGVLDRINTEGDKIMDSWVARVSADGALTADSVLETGAKMHAAAEIDENAFVTVGSGNFGRAMLLSNPDIDVTYQFDTNQEVSVLRDIGGLKNAFVAAGNSKEDAALVRLDCAGGQTNHTLVDLGGEERFEAVAAVYPGPSPHEETGYLAVGASNLLGKDRAIVAWRKKFSVSKPTAAMEVDGEKEVSIALGESVTLTYGAQDAGRYEIQKLSGPGPMPSVASGTIDPGESLNASEVLTFDNALSAQCTVDGCGATIYEIVATNRGHGRCQTGDVDRQTVTVFLTLDPMWAQLVQSSSEIMTKYGTQSEAPHSYPAHPNIDDFGRNRCISGLGLPYSSKHTLWGVADMGEEGDSIAIKDDEPQLLLYAANPSNKPAALVAYALGARFIYQQPTILGDDWTVDDDWLGHWGGWHTGEGGMTIVTPTEPGYGDWREPWITPPALCGSRILGCGAKAPWIRHPALWDVHVFFSPDGALPQVEFTSMTAEGVGEPCAAINTNVAPAGLVGCDTGDPSLGFTPFFTIDNNGAPVPMPAPPGSCL